MVLTAIPGGTVVAITGLGVPSMAWDKPLRVTAATALAKLVCTPAVMPLTVMNKIAGPAAKLLRGAEV